jgi:glycosyltransferase involved in cell wall biosynthesis
MLTASSKTEGRLLLVTPRFPPECCGVGDFTAQLAAALVSGGEDVVVLTQPAAGPRPLFVPLVEAPLRGWRNLRGALRAIVASGASRVQLEYSSYGWGRYGFSFAVNALTFALRLRGIPVTLACHEHSIRFTAHPVALASGLLQRLHFFLLYLAADEILANTPERVHRLRQRLTWMRERIHFRPNGSNIPPRPIAAEQREAIRRERGADAGTLVVALFTRFARTKNHAAVIHAVARLRQGTRAQLWLIGDSREADAGYVAALQDMTRLLGRDVFWSGHATPEHVSALLQAADVFVLPQADGNLTRSGAFMAAAAHGLPVVAVRNPENQEGFLHGEHVWLVDKATPECIAAALERLAADPALRGGLGSRLRGLYDAKFSWERMLAGRPRERLAPQPPLADAPTAAGEKQL